MTLCQLTLVSPALLFSARSNNFETHLFIVSPRRIFLFLDTTKLYLKLFYHAGKKEATELQFLMDGSVSSCKECFKGPQFSRLLFGKETLMCACRRVCVIANLNLTGLWQTKNFLVCFFRHAKCLGWGGTSGK